MSHLIYVVHNATFVGSIKVFFHLFCFGSMEEKQISQNSYA